MPRIAQGTTFVSDGSVHARVVVAPKKYLSRSLLGIVAEHETTGARLWAATLQEIVTTLRELGRAGEVTKAVETAINVGREDPKGGLERVRKSLSKLRADLREQEIRTPRKGKPTSPTVKKFGQRWTKGELHTEFPDHIPDKKSAHKDASNLETHVYPVIGPIPLAELTIEHCQDVMRRLSRTLSSSTRRHVAQVMVRLCNLAVYPCGILKASPLPKGFLPRVTVRAGAYLYPAEDAKLLATDATKVPLVNRLLYGFLCREGMRKEEALKLVWSDLDLLNGTITLDDNKTDDPRAWALDPGVCAALALWKKTQTAEEVFPVADPEHLPETLRGHLRAAGIARPQLFEHGSKRRQVNIHALRATFVTVSLANGKSEAFVMDRTGHRSSLMIARYRRQARTAAELDLGCLAPLNEALPEFVGAGKVQGRRRAPRGRRTKPRKNSSERPLGGMAYAGDLKAGQAVASEPSGSELPRESRGQSRRASISTEDPAPKTDVGAGTESIILKTIAEASAAGQWDVVRMLAERLGR